MDEAFQQGAGFLQGRHSNKSATGHTERLRMLTLQVTASEPPRTVEAIKQALEKEVYPIYRAWANELLNARLAGPNKGDVYTVTVDGQPMPGREAIVGAERSVVIRFVQATVDFAVRILSDELSSAINVAASPDRWVQRSQIAASVMLFYNGNHISKSTEIKNFKPGDYIMVVPSHINQAYGNAKRYGATGYMGRAARRIRSKLKITKGGSALTVYAGRSKAAWSAITRNGSHMTKPGIDLRTGKDRGFWGAWALILRYKVGTIYRG